MRHHTLRDRFVGLAAALGLLLSAAASGAEPTVEPTVELSIVSGKCTWQRGRETKELIPPAAPVTLDEGDVITTAENSVARIAIGKDHSFTLPGKSILLIQSLEYVSDQRVLLVGAELREGGLQVAIPTMTQQEAKDRDTFLCDLRLVVSKSVLRGNHMVGEVVLGGDGRLRAESMEGNPVIENGRIWVRLGPVAKPVEEKESAKKESEKEKPPEGGSGAGIEEGPPFIVYADPTNRAPVAVACPGCVIILMQPDQKAMIVITDEGMWVTNLREKTKLRAMGWTGAPVADIEAEEKKLFPCVPVERTREIEIPMPEPTPEPQPHVSPAD